MLHQGGYGLDINKNIVITKETVRDWKRLLREVVESPS